MDKNYKIAGLTVTMDVTGITERRAIPYLCTSCQEPDMTLTEGFREYYETCRYECSEEAAQHVYTANAFYQGLLSYQGMMIHSSAVVVDGRAYLFSAVSGTGKSTHTQLWLKQFGERAYILNDDKPALRLIDGVWYACGTPWSGKHDKSAPVCVPLAGIAILNRSKDNRIERHGGIAAVSELLEQTLRPDHKRAELLELLDKLVTQVPIWKLHCNMDPEAAVVAFNAMSGTEKE